MFICQLVEAKLGRRAGCLMCLYPWKP